MGIKEKSDGTFEVSYSARHPITRMPKSLKRTTTDKGKEISTKAEAQRIYNQLVTQVTEKLKESVSPTWSVMVKKFVEASLRRGLAAKTIENYRLSLEAHTVPVWGRRRVDSIRTEEIRALILDKLSTRSVSQQKNVLKFIRAVFNYALEVSAVSRNPTPSMKFRIGDKIKGVLTEKQIEILLNQAKELAGS